jgi:DNA topoisomerase-6 subunit B
LQQSGENIPTGPVVLVVHMASVWVPFTSEAKEAIAHYPEIIKEIKLALQELGRNLSKYVNKKFRVKDELKKRSYIEIYIPHVSEALREILNFKKEEEEVVKKKLEILLEKHRGKVDDMSFDPTKNVDYDEDLAKIGADEDENDDNGYDNTENGKNEKDNNEDDPVDNPRKKEKSKKKESELNDES